MCRKHHTPDTWARDFISASIQYGLSLWEARNHAIHGKTMKEALTLQRTRIKQRVKDLFEKGRSTIGTNYHHLFYLPLSQRLLKPTRQLQKWADHVELAIAENANDQRYFQPRLPDLFPTIPRHTTRRVHIPQVVTPNKPLIQADIRELLYPRKHTRFRTNSS